MRVILAYSAPNGQNAKVGAESPSQEVQRIKRVDNALEVPAADMGVHFRGFAGCMAEQGLNVTKVGSLLQEVGGRTMAQGMHTGGFLDAGLGQGGLHHLLKAACRVHAAGLACEEKAARLIGGHVFLQQLCY